MSSQEKKHQMQQDIAKFFAPIASSSGLTILFFGVSHQRQWTVIIAGLCLLVIGLTLSVIYFRLLFTCEYPQKNK